MHLHEYQAKMILRQYGIPVPDCAVITELSELDSALSQLGLTRAVLKVQVHAGGRGKAGGIKIGNTPEELRKHAQQLLGMKIVNAQTGQEGIRAGKLLVSPVVDIKKESYLAAAIDRQKGQAVLILSPQGGMEIEELAETQPELIKVVPIGPQGKLRNYQLIDIAKFMGWEGEQAVLGKKIVQALARAFVNTDALLLEINPLVDMGEGHLLALDAKMTIDDNALFRHPTLAEFYDATQLPHFEAKAHQHDLAYVALDGNIGCMVNGAGLAMATMDIIQFYGGSPANFLDVGGGASQEKISEGFKIILSDPKVKAILVNIFGGIMNCVTLSAGIIAAASDSKVHVPLVVRMEGTHVEQGKKMLLDSGIDIILADSLSEAAQKVVAAANRE